MSNYIRQSELLDFLQDWKFQESPISKLDKETEKYKTICEFINVSKKLPTVDEKEIIRKTVEKIIKRLEKHKSDWNDDYNVPINNAIEIVKKVGGLNERD